MLEAGDTAPDIALADQAGEQFSLAASRRESGARHLIFFYPKADTPGCTAQACGLRDVAHEVGTTVIVGISPDPCAKQARFDAKYHLGFPLLADTDHAVAQAYGVWKEKSMYGRRYMGIERSAFLVSPDGTVERAWYKISPVDTPKKLLEALRG